MVAKSLFFQVSSLSPGKIGEICEFIYVHHRDPGGDEYVHNATLATICRPDGSLYLEQLAALAPYLPNGSRRIFNNVFVGSHTVPWSGSGSQYREGMLSPSHRWANLMLQRKAWQAFATLFPDLTWHGYVEYEAPLDFLADSSVRAAYEAYLVQSARDLTADGFNRAVLWSPAFWASKPPSGLSGALETMFARVRQFSSVNNWWLHLQDMQGRRQHFSYDSVKDWYNTLQSCGLSSLRINMELFDVTANDYTADAVEVKQREAFYNRNNMPVGFCWEARWWHRLRTRPQVPAPPLKIVSPTGWGARIDYDLWDYEPWNVDKWVIHYGGGNQRGAFDGVEREQQILRAWEWWHIDGRRWRGIAYNYAIGMSGTIYRLRGENHAAATSGDYEPDGIPENAEARAVVFIMGGSQQPTQAALDAAKTLYNHLGRLPAIVHSDVKGLSYTSCPGSFLRNWVHGGGLAQ